MAVQQNKKSASKKRMRRSHHRVAVPSIVYCQCGEASLPHRACPKCGTYKGRAVVEAND